MSTTTNPKVYVRQGEVLEIELPLEAPLNPRTGVKAIFNQPNVRDRPFTIELKTAPGDPMLTTRIRPDQVNCTYELSRMFFFSTDVHNGDPVRDIEISPMPDLPTIHVLGASQPPPPEDLRPQFKRS
jgi:hypothetical protein